MEGRFSPYTKIYLTVHVRPRAREQEVEETDSGELKLRVKSPPSQGKANREVIELLAGYFRLPSSRIQIAKGKKSRVKIVCLEVEDRDLARFEMRKFNRKG